MRPFLDIDAPGSTVLRKKTLIMALSLAMLGSLLATGCSLPRRYYPADTESIRDLPVLDRQVKRIGVSRFENRSTAPHNTIVTAFQATLSGALERNCGKVELIDGSTDPDAPAFLQQPPLLEDGRMDTYAIALTARQSDFQIIFKGQLVSLRHRMERSGWASFRESHNFLDLRLQAVALDALTGVSIGQESQQISLPIDANTGAAVDAGAAADLPELEEIVNETGVDMALKLCSAIRAHPWQTVIRKIQDANMYLAARPAAGLKPGDRLAVFDGSRTMEGSSGERFVLPGFRLGTIAVKTVTDTAVVAVGEDGESFPVGSIIVPAR